MTKLKASRALEEFQAQPVPEGYEVVKVVRRNGRRLRFHGKLLASKTAGSRNHSDRWIELQLWQSAKGNMIAVIIRASDVEGESDIISAHVERLSAHVWNDASCDAQMTMEDHIDGIMDFFGWTNIARSLARDLGWQLEEFA